MITIDINSDLGEGFGRYRVADDRELISIVSSASIACGFHAGDPRVIDDAVACCKEMGVAVGAHVGYPDLVGFGRRVIEVSDRELETDVVYQLGALSGFCRVHGVRLCHVKPHGALYNRAWSCRWTAGAIARAVQRFDPELLVFAPAGSRLIAAARALGLGTVAEGFCDRGYLADNRLAPRGQSGALLVDPQAVSERAVALASGGMIPTVDGQPIGLEVQTVCVHGDSDQAGKMLLAVREALLAAGIQVLAPGRR